MGRPPHIAPRRGHARLRPSHQPNGGPEMTTIRVAAVQATYVLMNREATIDRVTELTAAAAADGAQLVVFPEAFVPGTPIWIDTQPIWHGDTSGSGCLPRTRSQFPAPERIDSARSLGSTAYGSRSASRRKSRTGGTIYNTFLYFSPDGEIVDKHRKLVPTGSERTVWGMGDGSTLRVVETPFGRIGGLICWENYMPLARFHLYAQGIDVWLAPTLAPATRGSRRCATSRARTGCSSSGSIRSSTWTRSRTTSRTGTAWCRTSYVADRARGSRRATRSSSAQVGDPCWPVARARGDADCGPRCRRRGRRPPHP